jgi:TetR/AcrR family transcriptional regulator
MKREALLRAAVSAFNRRGFSQTSLDEIAQNLGVTKAALYYYFPTKSALVAACFDRAMKVANESLAIAKRDGRDGREKLILMLRRYLRTMIGELNESLLLTE